jgi:PBSX family phage terminase large subunit
MQLTPAQSQIAKDTHRFRVLNCGRRFGKTVLAVEEMVGVAIAQKDRRVAYFAPTRDDAREITWAMLIKKCENIITYKNESLLHIKIMTQDGGESMIALYGWESVQERGKGRGLANDFIVCDEVSSYRNFWVGWDQVLSPTLIDRRGSAMFISTPKGFNHFYDLYNMQDKDPSYKSFHFTSYDNPNVPKDEIDREKLSKPEDAFAQEYLADFRKTTGLVYKDFHRDKHVFSDDALAKHAKLTASAVLVGIDWGYKNPCAILKAYKDADAHYWFVEEYYKTEKMTDEIIEYAKAMQGTHYYPDPAEPDRIELLRRAHVNVRDVSKDVEAGLDSVRALFKENRIHIHSSLVNLIGELETYRYGEKKPDSNEKEEPIKENDHAVDALRYMLYMQQPAGMSNKAKHFIPNHRRRI